MNAAAFTERVNVQTDWLETVAAENAGGPGLSELDPMDLLAVLGSLATLTRAAHMIGAQAADQLTEIARQALGT